MKITDEQYELLAEVTKINLEIDKLNRLKEQYFDKIDELNSKEKSKVCKFCKGKLSDSEVFCDECGRDQDYE